MKDSKITSGVTAQVGGGRSQNVGTGQSTPEGGNTLGSIVSNRRTVHGQQSAGKKIGGVVSAPIKFRMAARGAGKPE